MTESSSRLSGSPTTGPATRPGSSGPVFPAFRPAPGLRGPHRQTLVGRLVRAVGRVRYERESLETPDGDRLSLDRGVPESGTRAPAASTDAPILLVLHGLEGSAASGYVRETVRRALAAGLRPYALNFRSCDGAPNLRVRSYHSGETGDPSLVIARLRALHPAVPIVAVGYSLGGNVLLRLLAETGSEASLVAAAAVSVPFDLAASARHLARPGSALYTRYFLRSLRRKAREKARRFPGAFDAAAAARARTLRDFDEAVTAPVHGFAGAEDYYTRASSLPALGAIRVPTLLLQAEDDPFVPPGTLDAVRAVENPALRHAFSPHGGHLGFVERGAGPRLRPWIEAAAVTWLAERARETDILHGNPGGGEESLR